MTLSDEVRRCPKCGALANSISAVHRRDPPVEVAGVGSVRVIESIHWLACDCGHMFQQTVTTTDRDAGQM